MNIHISAENLRKSGDVFPHLQGLIDQYEFSASDLQKGRELVNAAMTGACFYEMALGYGQSFQSHLELLITVRSQNLENSVDVKKLRSECRRYLRFFEQACGS
jgi:hypothetical protein